MLEGLLLAGLLGVVGLLGLRDVVNAEARGLVVELMGGLGCDCLGRGVGCFDVHVIILI